MHRRIHLQPLIGRLADVPSVGSGSEHALLELDGAPLVFGNRSRVVLLANHLAEALHRGVERPRLVLLSKLVPAGDRAVLEWPAPWSGALLHVESFGELILEALRGAGEPDAPKAPPSIEKGRALELTLHNPYPDPLRATVALIIDALG